MLSRLMNWLRPKRQPSPLEVARQARRRAAEAYANAVQREDSRDVHWTLKSYRKATNEVLRLEKAEGCR